MSFNFASKLELKYSLTFFLLWLSFSRHQKKFSCTKPRSQAWGGLHIWSQTPVQLLFFFFLGRFFHHSKIWAQACIQVQVLLNLNPSLNSIFSPHQNLNNKPNLSFKFLLGSCYPIEVCWDFLGSPSLLPLLAEINQH